MRKIKKIQNFLQELFAGTYNVRLLKIYYTQFIKEHVFVRETTLNERKNHYDFY